MSESPTLSAMIDQLNLLKQQIYNSRGVSCSCVNCICKRSYVRSTLQYIDRPSTMEEIDRVMTGSAPTECECETNKQALREAMSLLNRQISDKINLDYNVESNPFNL